MSAHSFAFGAGRYESCSCGVERDITLREGKTVRLYRVGGAAWSEEQAPCADAPPPTPMVSAGRRTKRSSKSTGNGNATSLESVLTAAYPEAFAPEIIDGYDVVEAAKEVLLDVAFSPVLPSRNAFVPCDVGPLDGGLWRVYLADVEEYALHRGRTMDVSDVELRVMRARYLLTRGSLYRAQSVMGSRDRERIARLYSLAPLPAEGSALRRTVDTGEPLSVALADGQDPMTVIGALMREAYPDESGDGSDGGRLMTATTIPLRCWARDVTRGALCERKSEPGMRHIHIGERPGAGVDMSWIDEYCAPGAGPDGRETAALRILELSWRLDLIAFQMGEHGAWQPLLHAIASRLMGGTEAARRDLETLLEHVEDGERLLSMPGASNEATEARVEETIAALRTAADLLRPFAEGRN